MAFVTELVAPFAPWILGALAVLGALFYGRRKGREDERKDTTIRDMKAHHDTARKIDAVAGTDADAARKRMSDRSPDQR